MTEQEIDMFDKAGKKNREDKNFKPIYHFSFKPDNPFLMESINDGVYELNVIQKTVAKVMKGVLQEQEKALYKAMIQFAEKEGFTDMFLIDEDFLRSAIENEIKRRTLK